MSDEEESGAIRRILVALDASPHSLAALQAAAELARLLDAELVGVFVEDINLIRLAELPISRQVSLYSTTPKNYGPEEVERELHVQAERARKALATMAQRARLRSSFQVSRGVITSEIIQAAENADMIIIGKSGWSRRRRMGSTTRIIITQSPRQTLIIQHGARFGLHLGVLFDGTDEGLKALQVSMNLLRRRTGYLTVIVLAADVDEAREYQVEASRLLRRYEQEANYRWLLTVDANKLSEAAKSLDLGAVVFPVNSEKVSEEDVTEFLDETDVPVLLVR